MEAQSEKGEIKASGETSYFKPLRSKRQIIINNFLGGMFWAFGTFVGLAIIAVAAGFVLRQVDLIPIIGDWLRQIIERATTNLPQGPV